MKIALIGVPGSGKSDLAEALQMGDLGRKRSVFWTDYYVNRLSDELDRPYGHFATFLDNYQIAFERLRVEQAHEPKDDEVLVTCGTLIETILYTQIYARSVLQGDPRAESISMNIARGDVSARLYAQMIWDTWRYDYVFVLPLPPDASESEHGWNIAMNDSLVTTIEQFFIRYEVLDANATPEERAQVIVDRIGQDSANAVRPTDTVKSTVRSSDGDGEEVWSSTVPVSDVPDYS